MNRVIWATPLYEFLRFCNESPLDRKILDCGAGGKEPPLSLFYRHGYKTYGLEIQDKPLAEAVEFCKRNNMPLNIIRADMRRIPFQDEKFSFIYSFNAIFFMTKPDIAVAIRELRRVLKSGGLCYVNFRSVDDPDKRPFCKTAYARCLFQNESFSDFEDNEADQYFIGFKILQKEKQIIDTVTRTGRLRRVRNHYICEKK